MKQINSTRGAFTHTAAAISALLILVAPAIHAEDIDREASVDALFAQWDSADSPGCSIAIARKGEIIYRRGYGMANLDYDIPIKPESVFHVASVSKQFTAAAILLLAREGKLSLDDTVRKHLPQVPDFGVPVTIAQLIHHTSGLRDQWDLLGLAGWRYSLDLITDEDVMSLVARQKALNFPPGSEHLYSNTGYTLLGQIVKAVSGLSLREFTTQRIFEPLGMTRTHFRDDHAEIIKDQAVGYAWNAEKSAYGQSITNFDTVGATSLMTTASDLALWNDNFFSAQVGGPEFVEQQQQTAILNDGEPIDYAFGLTIGSYRGLRTVSHGGSDAGYRADFLQFPNQRFFVACLCNVAEIGPALLTRKIADIYLSEDFTEPAVGAGETEADLPPVALAAEALERYAGFYWSDAQQSALRLLVKDGKLLINPFGAYEFELRPLGESRFVLDLFSMAAEFKPLEGQDTLKLTVSGMDGSDPKEFLGVPDLSLSVVELESLAGNYRSEEIDPVYRLGMDGDQLVLNRLKYPPDPLTPVMRDILRSREGLILRVTHDTQALVTGFSLSTNRIRNLRFDRE